MNKKSNSFNKHRKRKQIQKTNTKKEITLVHPSPEGCWGADVGHVPNLFIVFEIFFQ